ncbi:hypothetical protein AK830_g5507 [Neonectria ditissima]|uniref:Heterokaryon incompatibility domain-containing protein n=1 Tax=Neonectria ditissima TaxID=78410 RepID=A0A0P7B3U6_9HYPO|nr:hypothetical protein AK830_g5507 [Neonectria ditissima]
MATKATGHEPTLPALNSAQAEIRILELEPGSPDSPVHCRFHVATLNDRQLPYEALSYAWGDTSATARQLIFLENVQVKVMQSLGDALQRLRRRDESRFLWVDALCINQVDDEEKTQQVGLMRRIYTQCTQCAIWLGSLGDIEPAHAEDAIHLLGWVAEGRDEPELLHDENRRRAAAAAFKAFITVPWWGRIWTVQEAILPRQAIVCWGPSEISWEWLRRAADRLYDNPGTQMIDEIWENNAAMDIQSVIRGLYMTLVEPLFSMLWRWRYRQATDPRDKVYGVLGFRDDVSLEKVTSCDYSIDVRTLYEGVTADLIRDGGDLEPLMGRGGEISEIPSLASWAVDWHGVRDDSKRSRSDFWEHHNIWHTRGYTADRGMYGVGDGLRMHDDHTLILQGLKVDRIKMVEDCQGNMDSGSIGTMFLTGGPRWGRLITRFHELYPGQLTENWMSAFLGLITGKLDPSDPDEGPDIGGWMDHIVRPQAVFVTESGRFGLGPWNTREGQEVWIVGGSRMPVILSPLSDEGSNFDFSFAAECVVYGIMKGEAVEGRGDFRRDVRIH